VNLNYEGHWVQSSKVVIQYGKKNYRGNEFFRRVSEHSCEKVESSSKDDDYRSCRNVFNKSFVSFSLAVIFIISSKDFLKTWERGRI